ncbi:MAG: hypothetical protein WBA57_06115 [Elainellaceae cyanobacterium]
MLKLVNQRKRLYQNVSWWMKPKEDDGRVDSILARAMTKTLSLGSPKPEPPPSADIF